MLKFLKYWLPVVVWAALIFIGSSNVPDDIPDTFQHADKLMHFAEYAVLGFLMLRAMSYSVPGWGMSRLRLITLIIVMCYGISDELHQHFVPGRMAELADLISDGLGAYVGQLLFKKKV